MDLSPTNGTKDSMDFVGCLILMPNLRSLEVFSAVPTTGSPILDRVKRDRAQFPSIRELWVTGVFAQFIGGCPNVESVGVNPGGFPRDIEDLCILGRGLKRLKRIAGIHKDYIQRGGFRAAFYLEASIHQMCHYGSRTGIPGPPGGLLQGHDWEHPHSRRESPTSRSSGVHALIVFA